MLKTFPVELISENSFFNLPSRSFSIRLIFKYNIYEQVKKDPTVKIKTAISKLIRRLLKQNKIAEQNKYYLTSIDITLERLIENNKVDNLPLTKNDIKTLLTISLNNSYCQFNSKF